MELAQFYVYGLLVALFVVGSALFADAFRRLFPKLSSSSRLRTTARDTLSRRRPRQLNLTCQGSDI
jgi:hypothetical protein